MIGFIERRGGGAGADGAEAVGGSNKVFHPDSSEAFRLDFLAGGGGFSGGRTFTLVASP